jgi:hypothetical protein
VTSVFGYGRRTLAKVTLRRDATGRAELVSEEYSRNGDGTVLESSAVRDRSAIHPVDQEHGVLHADRDVLRRTASSRWSVQPGGPGARTHASSLSALSVCALQAAVMQLGADRTEH